MDCSPPGSSVHGILQARILEWVSISFSRRSSQPRDWTRVSRIVGRCFTIWATREVHWLLRASSVGKKSTCNAGDPGSIPGSGRSAGEGVGCPLQYSWASLMVQLVKKSAYNAGDLGLILGLRRSPGEGKGYPFQYSDLENSMDYIVHGIAKSPTWSQQLSLSFFSWQTSKYKRM